MVRLPLPDAGLRVRELLRHPLVAAVPSEHPLAARVSLTLADRRGVPFVSYPAGRGSIVRDLVLSAFLAQGATPRIVQDAPDTHTLLSLVGASVGSGLTPDSAGHLAVPGVTLVPVLDAPALPLGLASRADDTDPAVAALVVLVDGFADGLRDLPAT